MVVAGKSHAMSSSNLQNISCPSTTFPHGISRIMHACMHAYVGLYQKCACVCAGMWYWTWETQQGFSCFSAEWRRGQSEGGQAVITNSIHFRNNNTALWVNRRLFSCGSHWSGPAKSSTHLLSLAVTSQEGALARLQSGPLIFSTALCTSAHSCACTHVGKFGFCV